MKKTQYNIYRGDLKKIALETEFSYSMVKKVSCGANKNPTIEKALKAITKKRNDLDAQVAKNLQALVSLK